MRDYKSLSHTRWDCKYHVVFIPKKRQKLIYGAIRKHLGVTFHELAQLRNRTRSDHPIALYLTNDSY